MKKMFLILFSLVYSISFCQDVDKESNIRLSSVGDIAGYGSGLWMKSNNSNKIKGSVYLFDKWSNLASVTTDKGEHYSINNINFDTTKDKFVSKVSLDSVFVFNSQNIKQIIIRNKSFKRYNVNGLYTFYEQIGYGKGKEILKKNFKVIKSGERNPFDNSTKPDKYVLKTKYFINSKEGIKELKLKKNPFLSVFENQSSKIKKFIKKNKLSIKKDIDIAEIFKYYNQL